MTLVLSSQVEFLRWPDGQMASYYNCSVDHAIRFPSIGGTMVDGTGLWQATKRLEGGTLHWPMGEGAAVRFRPEQLSALISGLEVTERAA